MALLLALASYLAEYSFQGLGDPSLTFAMSAAKKSRSQKLKQQRKLLQAVLEDLPAVDPALAAVQADDVGCLGPVDRALQSHGWNCVLAGLKEKAAQLKISPDSRCFWLLHRAAIDGATEAVAALVSELGADVMLEDGQGQTAAQRALEGEKWETLALLAQLGSPMERRGHHSRSMLSLAACRGPRHVLEALVAAGADMASKDNHGWAPLAHAVTHGNSEAVRALLELGADPYAQDFSGFTALSVAVRKHRLECFETLLAYGTDADAWAEKDLQAALAFAIRKQRWSLVDTLLTDFGVDPNTRVQGARGLTPLMLAAQRGTLDTVKFFLQHGADPMARSRKGLRASAYAFKVGNNEVGKYLKEAQGEAVPRQGNGLYKLINYGHGKVHWLRKTFAGVLGNTLARAPSAAVAASNSLPR